MATLDLTAKIENIIELYNCTVKLGVLMWSMDDDVFLN